jgi:hypothetical protein
MAAHLQAEAIAEALRQGYSVRDAAKAFGVGKSALAEHRRHLGITGKPVAKSNRPGIPDSSPDADTDSQTEVVGGDDVSGEVGELLSADNDFPRARDPCATWAKEAFGILDDKQRVRFITRRLVSGHEWKSSADVPALSAVWGVSEDCVRGYMKRAVDLAAADMGDVSQARLESLSWWRHMRDQAEDAAQGDIPEDLGPAVAAAALGNKPKFLAVAVESQKNHDRASGVVTSSTNIVVNLLQNPLVDRMLAVVRERLEPYPDALAAVAEGLQALKLEYAGAKSLPAGKGK